VVPELRETVSLESRLVPPSSSQPISVPVVQLSLVFDAGYAADQGRKPGSASFTMSMLDEGTKKLDALAIARRADELGASVSAGSSLDSSFVTLSALSERLDPSMALLADVTRNPEFPQAEIDRVRKQWLAGIAQEKTVPDAVALRLLPPLIYGEGHPYAIPLTGSGTEASIVALTREDLQSFHRDWIRPDNLTIVVAGDASPEQVLPLLEKHFGDWRPPTAARPAKTMPSASRPATTRVYLVDRPGAQQSNIIVGQVTAPSSAPDALQMATMNQVIGGSFTSRINLNLREDKHWTYGARSNLPEARGERPWLLTAPVQTDKTAEAALEIQREIQEYIGSRPATSAEIQTVKNRDVRALPGRFETNAAVTSAVTDMIVFGRPDDYVVTLKDRIEAQTDESVRAAARASLRPGQMTWVIVGDLAQIEQPIRVLSLGEVQVLDADGNRLR
jgi:predicted Zn-dependent peptidase